MLLLKLLFSEIETVPIILLLLAVYCSLANEHEATCYVAGESLIMITKYVCLILLKRIYTLC